MTHAKARMGISGFAVTCAAAVTAILGIAPASAQAVVCPPGYYYTYGYGCVPASSGYDTIYGAPGYAYPPPVYDSFGMAFGFGGGGRGGRGRGGEGRGGGGGHGGGGGRGGGGGGGGHGGGHR